MSNSTPNEKDVSDWDLFDQYLSGKITLEELCKRDYRINESDSSKAGESINENFPIPRTNGSQSDKKNSDNSAYIEDLERWIKGRQERLEKVSSLLESEDSENAYHIIKQLNEDEKKEREERGTFLKRLQEEAGGFSPGANPSGGTHFTYTLWNTLEYARRNRDNKNANPEFLKYPKDKISDYVKYLKEAIREVQEAIKDLAENNEGTVFAPSRRWSSLPNYSVPKPLNPKESAPESSPIPEPNPEPIPTEVSAIENAGTANSGDFPSPDSVAFPDPAVGAQNNGWNDPFPGFNEEGNEIDANGNEIPGGRILTPSEKELRKRSRRESALPQWKRLANAYFKKHKTNSAQIRKATEALFQEMVQNPGASMAYILEKARQREPDIGKGIFNAPYHNIREYLSDPNLNIITEAMNDRENQKNVDAYLRAKERMDWSDEKKVAEYDRLVQEGKIDEVHGPEASFFEKINPFSEYNSRRRETRAELERQEDFLDELLENSPKNAKAIKETQEKIAKLNEILDQLYQGYADQASDQDKIDAVNQEILDTLNETKQKLQEGPGTANSGEFPIPNPSAPLPDFNGGSNGIPNGDSSGGGTNGGGYTSGGSGSTGGSGNGPNGGGGSTGGGSNGGGGPNNPPNSNRSRRRRFNWNWRTPNRRRRQRRPQQKRRRFRWNWRTPRGFAGQLAARFAWMAVVSALISAFKMLTGAAERAAQKMASFGQYDSNLFAANMVHHGREFQRNVKFAQGTSVTGARLIASNDAFKDAALPILIDMQNTLNEILKALLDWLRNLIAYVAGLEEKFKEFIENTPGAEKVWGWVKDAFTMGSYGGWMGAFPGLPEAWDKKKREDELNGKNKKKERKPLTEEEKQKHFEEEKESVKNRRGVQAGKIDLTQTEKERIRAQGKIDLINADGITFDEYLNVDSWWWWGHDELEGEYQGVGAPIFLGFQELNVTADTEKYKNYSAYKSPFLQSKEASRKKHKKILEDFAKSIGVTPEEIQKSPILTAKVGLLQYSNDLQDLREKFENSKGYEANEYQGVADDILPQWNKYSAAAPIMWGAYDFPTEDDIIAYNVKMGMDSRLAMEAAKEGYSAGGVPITMQALVDFQTRVMERDKWRNRAEDAEDYAASDWDDMRHAKKAIEAAQKMKELKGHYAYAYYSTVAKPEGTREAGEIAAKTTFIRELMESGEFEYIRKEAAEINAQIEDSGNVIEVLNSPKAKKLLKPVESLLKPSDSRRMEEAYIKLAYPQQEDVYYNFETEEQTIANLLDRKEDIKTLRYQDSKGRFTSLPEDYEIAKIIQNTFEIKGLRPYDIPYLQDQSFTDFSALTENPIQGSDRYKIIRKAAEEWAKGRDVDLEKEVQSSPELTFDLAQYENAAVKLAEEDFLSESKIKEINQKRKEADENVTELDIALDNIAGIANDMPQTKESIEKFLEISKNNGYRVEAEGEILNQKGEAAKRYFGANADLSAITDEDLQIIYGDNIMTKTEFGRNKLRKRLEKEFQEDKLNTASAIIYSDLDEKEEARFKWGKEFEGIAGFNAPSQNAANDDLKLLLTSMEKTQGFTQLINERLAEIGVSTNQIAKNTEKKDEKDEFVDPILKLLEKYMEHNNKEEWEKLPEELVKVNSEKLYGGYAGSDLYTTEYGFDETDRRKSRKMKR